VIWKNASKKGGRRLRSECLRGGEKGRKKGGGGKRETVLLKTSGPAIPSPKEGKKGKEEEKKKG